MAIGVASPTPILQFFANNGLPAVNGSLLTQVGGINAATYQDVGLTTPLPNPIPLNSRGEVSNSSGVSCQLFLTPNTVYTFTLSDAQGNQQWTATYVNGIQVSQSQIAQLINPQVQAEITLGVTPSNYLYPVGHVYRYGTNTNPGTTDMTAPINTAANVCRQGNYQLLLPADPLLVSSSVNFSGITVQGLGGVFGGSGYIIRTAGSTFDIVTSTGNTILKDMRVDGANPSLTGGLVGDNISFKATSPAHPYLITLIDVASTNARARCCYIERGGYTSFFHVQFLGAGLHALECVGTTGDSCTTIRDYGSSQFSSCPNGFGIKLTETAAIGFHDSIVESTGGISLNGSTNNEAITFDGVYQEQTFGSSFVGSISGGVLTVSSVTSGFVASGQVITGAGVAGGTFLGTQLTGPVNGPGTYNVAPSQTVASTAMTGSPVFITDNAGGKGITFRGCFGGNTGMPQFTNWLNVYYQGNALLTENFTQLNGRMQTNAAGQGTVSTTSDVTVAQIALGNTGTYRVSGRVQTILSSGAGSITQLACQVSTNPAASGLNNSTTSGGFNELADQTQSFDSTQGGAVKVYGIFTGGGTIYLRAHIVLSGSIVEAYYGFLRAELIE